MTDNKSANSAPSENTLKNTQKSFGKKKPSPTRFSTFGLPRNAKPRVLSIQMLFRKPALAV
jgi:hypothetical protein